MTFRRVQHTYIISSYIDISDISDISDIIQKYTRRYPQYKEEGLSCKDNDDGTMTVVVRYIKPWYN
jgi:hypothetical protein